MYIATRVHLYVADKGCSLVLPWASLTCPSSCRSYCSYTRSKLDTRALCSFRLYLTSTVVLDLTFSKVCLRSTMVVLFSVTCIGSVEFGGRGDREEHPRLWKTKAGRSSSSTQTKTYPMFSTGFTSFALYLAPSREVDKHIHVDMRARRLLLLVHDTPCL